MHIYKYSMQKNIFPGNFPDAIHRFIYSFALLKNIHRKYGSVYSGSLVFTYFQIKLCECWISKFTEFLIVKYSLQYEISTTIPTFDLRRERTSLIFLMRSQQIPPNGFIPTKKRSVFITDRFYVKATSTL